MTETAEETQTEAPEQETPEVEPAEPGEPTPEEQEEADAEDTEPEPEPEPAGPSVEQQQKQQDKAFRRAKTYAKGVLDDLGDMAQTVLPCPRCSDFLPGLVLPHAIKPVTEEQRVAVKVSMGENVEPSFVQSNKASACAACDGWGRVATGSKVRGQDKVTCPDCNGKGWTGPLQVIPQPPSLAAVPSGDTEAAAEPGEPPQTDPWGRLRGDPLYGVMPGFEQ